MKKYIYTLFTALLFIVIFGTASSFAEFKTGLPKLYLNDVEVNTTLKVVDGELYLQDESYAPFGAKTLSTGEQPHILVGDTELVLDLHTGICAVYQLERSKFLPSNFTVIKFLRDGKKLWLSARDLAPYLGYKYSRINQVDLFRLTDGNQTITDPVLYALSTTPPKTSLAAKGTDGKNYATNKPQKVSSAKKIVYLTFDDGPNQHTGEILRLLKKYDQKATFFMLYNGIQKMPDTVLQIHEEGHGIGLHGVTHRKNLFYKEDTSPVKEMNTDNDALANVVDFKTTLVRTPYGSKPYLSSEQYKLLVAAGYNLWDWNVDSADSSKAYVAPSLIESRVITGLKAKSTPVVLMHDKACTAESLESILIWMQKNNYKSLPLTDDMTPLNWSK